jgi:phospholipid/cholesterol/gamma-HCH transport system substrate-binding protein
VKNYFSIALKPRPDKYFLLEFVSDPHPSPTFSTTTTNVTAGGVTTSVLTEREEVKNSRLLISAQFAKKFYDFTIHGGLIESTGGVGLDYNKGPFSLQFSAFDFTNTAGNQNPHLKVMGTMNLTKGFYLLGGVDDFISKQHGPDWFFGAGLRFLDEDIKSLVGALQRQAVGRGFGGVSLSL